MSIWETIATERERLATDLEALTEEQWRADSQCEGWTVAEMAAHLILPFEVSNPRFMLSMLKNRGNLDKTSMQLTAKVHAANSQQDVIKKLRANASNQWTPPRFGAEVPLSEVVVHGADIRRPLGLESTIPSETIDLTLEGIKDEKVRTEYARRLGR